MKKLDENGFGHFAYLKEVKLSKDGRKVAYVTEKANFNKDTYEHTIVIRDLETDEEKFIKDANAPRFSPDGRFLYYLKTDESRKIVEVYEVEINTMSERKIFEEKEIKDILPSMSGEYLLVVHNKELEDDYLYFIDELPPWFDTMGFFAKKRNVHKVIDPRTGVVISEIEKKPFTIYIWHEDKLLLSEPKGNNPWIDYKITVFDPKNEEEEVLFDGKDFFAFDSDGKNILLLGREKREKLANHKFLYLWDGVNLKNLTEKFIYNNVMGFLMKDDRVVYTYDYRGSVIMAITDGQEKKDVFGEGYNIIEISTNGEKVAFIAGDEAVPSEIYLYDGGKVDRITNYNDKVVEVYKPRRAHHFTFESLGFEIDGWYLKPDIDEGKKAPVVLFVHGGPKGMYGHRFVYTMQHLAAEGFYTVYFNPRGSTGYTEDFARKVVQRTGLEDFQDIMKGLDKFFEIEKDADPERVGITGISYGGFMTNWAISQTDRFKAAVSENGISLWLTSYTFSDIGIYFDHELIGKNPLKDDFNYKKLSPLYYVENVDTPLLIIHSLEDYRCPIDQSLMLYNVLKNMGKKEVYFALFKKGFHVHSGTGTPKHRAKRYKLIRDFFYRKLVQQKEGFEYKPE